MAGIKKKDRPRTVAALAKKLGVHRGTALRRLQKTGMKTKRAGSYHLLTKGQQQAISKK